MMLTSIISPGVAGVVILVVLAGGYLMNRIIQKKYGYPPERETELERKRLSLTIDHTHRVKRNVTEVKELMALWERRIGGKREKNWFFDKWR